MKNAKIYPFERNKYFYGKLLSVEDFNSEQKYMNDKRRLANRLVSGIGVVAGMNVVQIDEQTISLESGLAFDSTGREIVVDVPVTKKLSLINGYESVVNGSNSYAYLCIEYAEKDKGEVHNVVSSESDGAVYNKVKENYNLFLTCAEPEDSLICRNDIFEQKTTVYWDGKLRIVQIMPRYVAPDEEFELRIEVECYTKEYASFAYDLQLICLNNSKDKSSVLRVSFDEMLFEKARKYTLTYNLISNDVINTDGTAMVDPATFMVSYDKKAAVGSAQGKSTVTIIKGNVTDAVMQNYYRTGMDTLLRASTAQNLYLARIRFVDAGGSLIIDDIDNVPFDQYVANNMLLSAIDRLNGEKVISRISGTSKNIEKEESEKTFPISSGVCRINFTSGGSKNKVFFSKDIIHGLGLGSVSIILGADNGDGMVYGSSSIFKSELPSFECAAKLDPTKGSFIIGVMLKSSTISEYIDIKWTAVRDVEETINEKSSMRLSIKPNTLVIKPRESHYLEAVCANMTNQTVRWQVASENDGQIDANGLYVAPNVPGVYEVIARSVAYPEIQASIMVVVRE